MSVSDNFTASHHPLCVKYISGDDLPCICDLLDEHTAEVRERIAQEIERNHAQSAADGSEGDGCTCEVSAWIARRGKR
jgi:hypothetical protein